MTDNLITRASRLIAGGAHSLMDRIEDSAPLSVLEQAAREVDGLADEVRGELGKVLASKHLTQNQHLTLNAEHESLGRSIETAVNSSKDDLARSGIARQFDIEAQLPALETKLAAKVEQEKNLTYLLQALLDKRREMDQSIRAFEAAQRIKQETHTQGVGASDVQQKLQSAQSTFDRVHQRHTGGDATMASSNLDQAGRIAELTQFNRNTLIENRLTQLKAKRQ